MEEIHILSYSPSQQAYHIESLPEHLIRNAENIVRWKDGPGNPDFLAIAASTNRAELYDITIESLIGKG